MSFIIIILQSIREGALDLMHWSSKHKASKSTQPEQNRDCKYDVTNSAASFVYVLKMMLGTTLFLGEMCDSARNE